jgi:DNA ligase (NAD+)
VIVDRYRSIEVLAAATAEELQTIQAIGPKIAESIEHFFREKHNKEIIRRLKEAGVTMSAPASSRRGPLSGKTFVVTGTLPNYSREDIKRLIEEHGGKVASAVSRNVQYVIVGEDPGSKLTKARSLNIPTLSEKEFNAMLK